jgi:1-acyl-sn-glycerol-3-phosphate acyltransferase
VAIQPARLFARDVDTSDLAARDPEFIRSVALPVFDALRVHYFRAEIDGVEHIPRTGPFIAVANHNGGPLLPDCWVLAAYWWSVLGVERPAYAMVHDAALRIPLLRDFLAKVGGLRGSRESATKVLRQGAPLLVYPGGELDCLKSFWRRHTIDFHGRTGFVQLALEHGVPIVPIVDVGGHEVYFTLLSSQRLARWTGMARWTRVKTVPVNVGLPWGVWITGFVPYLPLPAKFVYRVGLPIALGHDPEAARDERAVRCAYDRITRIMQTMLDGLVRERRLPVFG